MRVFLSLFALYLSSVQNAMRLASRETHKDADGAGTSPEMHFSPSLPICAVFRVKSK